MRIKLVIVSLMTVISLIGMENGDDNADKDKIIKYHKQYFPCFLKSIQTTNRIIFNFNDFAATSCGMTMHSTICIVNGRSTIKRYLDELDAKILLYSKGKAQSYLNLSDINEEKLQNLLAYEDSWKAVGNQEEIDASAIIYNIAKDCLIPMEEHVANIKCLKDKKGKNNFKHLVINIDQRRTDRSVIDDLIKKLPIEQVVIVKPVEQIASTEVKAGEEIGEDRFGKPIIIIKKNVVNNNDNSVATKNADHTRFKYFNAIWSYKEIFILAIIGLFIG